MTDVSTSSAVVFRVKMTTAQEVETSVTNNSLSKDYPHSDDHAKQITDTPGFKPFTNIRFHGRPHKSGMDRRGELSQTRKTEREYVVLFLVKMLKHHWWAYGCTNSQAKKKKKKNTGKFPKLVGIPFKKFF